MIKMLSLFSGIGAFEVALDRENIDWKLDHYCEIDKYASIAYNAVHGTTDEDNLNDVTNVDYSKLGEIDLVTYGFPCLVGDSLVNTGHGLKEISKINVGDTVIGHDNKWHKVTRFMYQGEKKIFIIKGLCFDKIETTDNHRYYVRKLVNDNLEDANWVACKDLEVGDYLGYPIDACMKYSSQISKVDGGICISSSNKKFIYEIAQSIMKSTQKPVSIKQLKNGNFEVNTNIGKEIKVFFENDYIWYPITEVFETDYSKDVYDISVEGSNSFVVNNCITHNCQDISIAGKGRGFVDDEGNVTRSGLFFNAADVIKKTNPKFAIFENVKNLTGKKFKNEFETVLNTLDELGYNTYWKVLNAKDFGVPQNRERVIGISIRKDIDKGYTFPEGFPLDKRLKDVLESDVDEKYYLSEKAMQGLILHKKRHKEKGNGFGFEIRDVRDTANAIVCGGSGLERNLVSPTISARYHKDGSDCLLKVEQVGNFVHNPKRPNPSAGRVYDPNGLSPTLNTCMGGHREPSIILENEPLACASRGRYLEGNSGETAQHLEVNETGCSNSLTTVQKDNYILEPKNAEENFPCSTRGSQVASTIRASIFKQGERNLVKNVLDGQGYEGVVELRDKANNVIIDDTQGFDGVREYEEYSPSLRASRSGLKTMSDDFRVRKLTPKECWRLMNFSDEEFDRAKWYSEKEAKEIIGKSKNKKLVPGQKIERLSDTQLYKTAGNSIVVSVLQYVFRELKNQYPEEFKEKQAQE